MSQASLLWIDLEMTGLDPAVDRIVEVGAIATTFDLVKVAEYQAVVRTDSDLMRQRMVGEFWDQHDATRQQLLAQNESDRARESDVVQAELIQFIRDNFDLDQPIYLAGNSVHQDQKFMAIAWPKLMAMLSYRILDVSAWKIIFEQHGVRFTKPEQHRAMSDIQGSIDELKYYLKRVRFNK